MTDHTLIIRADAGPDIGAGHVMRCLALAFAWRNRGGRVTFLSSCRSEPLRRRIESSGFEVVPIERPCPDAEDIEAVSGVVEKDLGPEREHADCWVVIDGYHFDYEYQRAVRDLGCQVLVIDDIADRPRFSADVILNQNLGAERLRYHCDSDTTLLLGTEYVLLRPQFLEWKDWTREIPETARKILVTMGAGDPDNVTRKVIRALETVAVDDLHVRCVIGPANPHGEALESAVGSFPGRLELLRNVEDMPSLMAWADLAVSAAGSTCWELAFMRVPAVTIQTAENQRLIAEGLREGRYSLHIGDSMSLEKASLAVAVEKLALDAHTRREFSRRGRDLVDGLGAGRVVNEVIE